VHCSRKGAGIGITKADDARAGHGFYGRPSSYKADGFGGAWPWPAVRPPGKEAHRHAACVLSGRLSRKSYGRDVLKESGRRKHRFTIRDLLADKKCSQAVLNFLSALEVGRLVPTGEDAGSEVLSGSAESGKDRGGWRRELWVSVGRWVVGRSRRCSYPRPPSWHPPKMGSMGRVYISLCHFPLPKSLLSAAISFVKTFLGAYLNLLGQAWAEGKGELATCRHRAGSGRETWIEKVRRHSLDGYMRV